MSEQKTKDFLNLWMRIVVLCGAIGVVAIVLWKLSISDLYFDFTNFTSYDIIIIIVSIFLLAAFWKILIKILNLIENKTETPKSNEELIDRLLLIISEQIKSNKSSERNNNTEIEGKKIYDMLNELSNKLDELNNLIKNISNYKEKEKNSADSLNISKDQSNNSGEHINLLLKKIIKDHFEVSTLKMLPIEIFEFRIKKLINELDQKTINDLIQYEIIDSKKQITEKGRSKLIELTNKL
jgi:hypothetical protein